MSKITDEHLKRAACVYVRQSSVEQLRNNTESQRRQYALAEKARGLGFSEVMVIDEDLGRSGSGIARPGFERLLALICAGRIGAVFAIEASRLARNGRDWHTLLELCGLVNAILMDEDGEYDPRHPNDRLLLGMKGTMSELELSLLRQRALEAIRSKAARGELHSIIAVGYVRSSGARLEKDPDRRVREALELVFRKFEELRSARQVMLWLREHGVELPAVIYGAEGRRILWAAPTYTRVHRILHNPVYAGAYVFGRTSIETRVEGGRKRLRKARVAHPRWRVCKPNQHEGYIDWETYLRNQQRLAENTSMRGEAVRGAVRQGDALLVGLLRCGHCGRKLAVGYSGEAGLYPRYYCRGAERERMNRCISFAGWRVDRAVTEELLKVVTPLGVEAALQAIDACDSEGDDACRQIETALEQARYEARLAQRQYEACDPDNRLVAAELERRWNDRLVTMARLQEDLAMAQQSAAPRLTDAERSGLRALGDDLPRAWHDPSATAETRKRILRAAVKEIVVRVEDEKIQLLLHWQGGDHTAIVALKNKTGEHRWKTGVDTEQLIGALARQMADFSLASLLNRIGMRSAKGLTWNEARLRSFRSDRGIPVYRKGERAERGELTLDEAAKELGISKMTMLRLIERRVVAAQQVCPQAPWVIRSEDIRRPEVQQALRARAPAPQPVDPDQGTLKYQ